MTRLSEVAYIRREKIAGLMVFFPFKHLLYFFKCSFYEINKDIEPLHYFIENRIFVIDAL